ncbi:MAG TPA: hypothetical protein VK427_06395 [Kofleriaceae bacterium]|nr:hypothetical protein [Kofleriaceae bacterium]
MDDLIETIRTAIATDASDETRAAGAQACRTLLTALDTKPGEPLTGEPPASSPPESAGAPFASTWSPPDPHAAAHAIASVLRGMTPDQLLDLAIARLRAALPPGAAVPTPEPVKFHLIHINPSVL